MALPCRANCHRFYCLVWSNAFAFIKNLLVLFHYTSHCVVDASEGIEGLAVIVGVDCGDEAAVQGGFHRVNEFCSLYAKDAVSEGCSVEIYMAYQEAWGNAKLFHLKKL